MLVESVDPGVPGTLVVTRTSSADATVTAPDARLP
jgi:hypothetical protein